MQWFMTSIVIGGIGVSYIVSMKPNALTLGRIMLPIAIALACYSLLVFHWRSHMLLSRQPSASYGDRCGPTGLSLAFLCVLIWGIVVTVPSIMPPQPIISAFCTSRMCYQMERCTLPLTLSTPPKQDFSPSGMTTLADSLYISSTDGRIGVVDPDTNEVNVWQNYWLAPGTPTQFTGVASVPGRSKHLYGVRDQPSPAILEIDVAGRTTKRTFTFDTPPNAALTGLAIAPSKSGTFVAYVPTRDGWISMYGISLSGNESSTASFIDTFHVGKLSNLVNLSPMGTNVTKKSPTILAQYNHGQLIIINDKFVYAYNLTEEGRPIGFDTYQAFSFGIPAIKGLAFASDRAFLVTQDDEGGRDNARVMGVEYDRDSGFSFCK
jgi:hypothetical protein